MSITYASVCDGIGAVHVAWQGHPGPWHAAVPRQDGLGWRCAFTSEIEPFPAAVVEHHYKLPNLGDMTKIDGKEAVKQHGPIDLVCGGTPCQSFSVAGLRKGMADPRGNLALVYLRLVDQIRPRWVVWENVPGVLSSAGGRDFGSFLGALGQLGYGWPTEFWTHSFSAWPSDAAVCSLSDVLETGDVPQRYFLSPKACAGILRRAEKRGRELPMQLLRALEQVAGVSSVPAKREDKTR